MKMGSELFDIGSRIFIGTKKPRLSRQFEETTSHIIALFASAIFVCQQQQKSGGRRNGRKSLRS
jgi:hypothetical protein